MSSLTSTHSYDITKNLRSPGENFGAVLSAFFPQYSLWTWLLHNIGSQADSYKQTYANAYSYLQIFTCMHTITYKSKWVYMIFLSLVIRYIQYSMDRLTNLVECHKLMVFFSYSYMKCIMVLICQKLYPASAWLKAT